MLLDKDNSRQGTELNPEILSQYSRTALTAVGTVHTGKNTKEFL
jgi:hypothetical protein